jgi:HlyD family secretion protein
LIPSKTKQEAGVKSHLLRHLSWFTSVLIVAVVFSTSVAFSRPAHEPLFFPATLIPLHKETNSGRFELDRGVSVPAPLAQWVELKNNLASGYLGWSVSVFMASALLTSGAILCSRFLESRERTRSMSSLPAAPLPPAITTSGRVKTKGEEVYVAQLKQGAGAIQHRTVSNYLGISAGVFGVAALLTGAALAFSKLMPFSSLAQSPASAPSTPVALTPDLKAVTASGRLEPEGEVIRLSSPSSVEVKQRISKLLVKEGERVRPGQIIATLDSAERRQAGLARAQEQVGVARARLAQTKAGAKSGELTAQEATIGRLKAELRNAEAEDKRNRQLYTEGAISTSISDSKRLAVETLREQLNQSRANLSSLAEVRPTDIRLATAQVKDALGAVKEAQAELELTNVRTPKDGQILKIYSWPGEVIDQQGIADLGRTEQMFVVAEVYESDIDRIRVGQRANISSDALAGKFKGTVTQVAKQIRKKDILDADPVADVDSRVVEVKIRLDPVYSKQVTNLTNLKVEVNIAT